MAEPISIETLSVKRELLKDVKTFAAIDRGCSLTKVLYVPKKDTSEEHYNLTCATFLNVNFQAGLDWLINEGTLPTEGDLHVTGVGCDKYRDVIAEKTKLSVRFVDEFHAQVHGASFLVANMEDSDFCHPDIEVKSKYQLPDKGFLKKIRDKHAAEVLDQTTEEKFPVLYTFLGSGGLMTKVNADGSWSMAGVAFLAGKVLLGLGKLILGTADYKEIMELAEKGDKDVIDTLVKDVFSEDDESPYTSMFGREMPLFNLGKISDPENADAQWKKEDLAAALIYMLVTNLVTAFNMSARMNQTRKIYIGGNMARAEIVRRFMYERIKLFPSTLSYKFVKTGHTGALGAMLTKPGEEKEMSL